MNTNILVLDYETTGVDVDTLTPLEIAFAVITFNNKGELVSQTKIHSYLLSVDVDKVLWTESALNLAKETKLYDDLRDSDKIKISLEQLDVELMAIAKEYPKLVLGGSGVAEFDRLILRRFHPKLEQHLEVRSACLGAFRKVLKVIGHPIDYTKEPFAPFPNAHRAAGDVLNFITQYTYFAKKLTIAEDEPKVSEDSVTLFDDNVEIM